MFKQLLSVLLALLVSLAFLWQGTSLVVFASGVNAAYSSEDLVEIVGHVARRGSIPLVPRDTVVIPPRGELLEGVGSVKVVPDPDEAVDVGEPRTVLLSPERPHVARYKHADLTRPGDRYYVAGALTLAIAITVAVLGVRDLVNVLRQRSPDFDQDRVRFAGHHRHGA